MSIDAVMKWIEIAKLVLPFVFQAKGLDPKKAQAVTQLVTDAEGAIVGDPGQKLGPQRAAAVLKGVDDALALAGATPEHTATIKDMVTVGLTDGIKLVNDVHALKAPAPPAGV